jgi:serine/threonine protein kinase
MRSEFKNEVSCLAALSHPNLLQMIAIVPQRLGIVTEWCKHGDLAAYISKNRDPPLSQAARLQISKDVAQGMAWLAHNNYVHRDLKLQVNPSGMLLNDGKLI